MPKANDTGTELIVTNADGFWSFLSDYRDDLTFAGITSYVNTDHDIMEVYGLATLGAYTVNFDGDRRDILWKREEAKKMTVEEIEKELGYKIEIVS